MSERLNNLFKRFIQKHWFIQLWNKWSIYEWVTESFIQEIRSKTLIHPVMKQDSDSPTHKVTETFIQTTFS